MRRHLCTVDGLLPVGRALREIRTALGWSEVQAATNMGISYDAWRPIECGNAAPTLRFITEFRYHTGIDPYAMAYILYFDGSQLPWYAEEQALRSKVAESLEAMKSNFKIRPGWQWT